MSIVNRRNAVLGWVAWAVGKRALKRKAKAVVPHRDRAGKGRSRWLLALPGVALVAGAGAWAWRKIGGGADGDNTHPGEESGGPVG